MNAANQNDLLNSWKEIAVYLNRGVRTVQRWEAELGLPVRRPRGMSRSAVIAMRSEIDEWLRACPVTERAERTHATVDGPRLSSPSLIIRSHELRSDMCRNRDEMGVSLNKLMITLKDMLGQRAS